MAKRKKVEIFDPDAPSKKIEVEKDDILDIAQALEFYGILDSYRKQFSIIKDGGSVAREALKVIKKYVK